MPVDKFNNYSAQNKEQTFKAVQGIDIKDDLIYIADVEKHNVVVYYEWKPGHTHWYVGQSILKYSPTYIYTHILKQEKAQFYATSCMVMLRH